MKKRVESINNKEDVIKAVKNESITCKELALMLKQFPELVNSSELFAISCQTLKLEYVEAFLSAGISLKTIKESNYQQQLIKACEKLIAKNTENMELQKAKVQIVEGMYKSISNAIKNYQSKNSKKNKRS